MVIRKCLGFTKNSLVFWVWWVGLFGWVGFFAVQVIFL